MVVNFFSKYKPVGINGLSKYAQLREAIRNAISDGYWKTGDKLLPESELVRITPFSLGTVQRALGDLVKEGLVERRQGLGTFVIEHNRQMQDPWHFRFYCNGDESPLPVYPKVLSQKEIYSQESWVRLISPRSQKIIQIERKVNIGNKFNILSRFYLSRKFETFLSKSPRQLNTENFKNILRQEYNIPITHISHNLQMMLFEDDICRTIEITSKTVGLRLEIMAASGKNNHIYFNEVFIPPSNQKLRISDSLDIPEYWT